MLINSLDKIKETIATGCCNGSDKFPQGFYDHDAVLDLLPLSCVPGF